MGDSIKVLNLENDQLEVGKVTKLLVSKGALKEEISEGIAGDIVTIAGVNAFVADTICDPEVTQSIETSKLDPPTISMTFGVNDAPISGKEGKFVTSSSIKDRLIKECEVFPHLPISLRV
jgi:GTP-binding protein